MVAFTPPYGALLHNCDEPLSIDYRGYVKRLSFGEKHLLAARTPISSSAAN